MKIAIYHNLPSGGAKRALWEMVRNLAVREHELWEFSPTTAAYDFLPLDQFSTGKEIFNLRLASPIRRWIPLLTPYINLGVTFTNFARADSLARIVAEKIDKDGFDLVFCHDCQVTGVPSILRYLRTPSVFYCHHGAGIHLQSAIDGLTSAKSRTKNVRHKTKEIYYAPARFLTSYIQQASARRSSQAATRNWTNSSFSRERMLYYYGVDSLVVSLGVNTSIFRPLPIPKQRFILSVGSLYPIKGYDFLIRALGKISTSNRPELVIAANSIDPSYQHKLTVLAEELGVQCKVVQVFDDEQLILLYNQAALLAYTPVMEAFGLVALESMACGTPVVAVREGGIRESVQDDVTGILTDRQEDAFADALQRIIQDGQLRKRLGDAGPAYVAKQWSWVYAVDRIETLFNTMLARH